MSLSFTVDEVLNALYGGILNRAPDPSGAAAISEKLTTDPSSLTDVVSDLLLSPERCGADHHQAQTLRAIYRAALGREPDAIGSALYGPWIQNDFDDGVMKVADALFNCPEYQERILPLNLDRVLVDHSPNGELRAILRELAPHHGDSTLIVEVGIDNPGATVSLDLVKLLDWRAVLIEPAQDRQIAIESRFSGTNYRLLPAEVLIRSPLSANGPSDPQTKLAADLELLDLEATQPQLASLSKVLEKAGIPNEFGVLAIGVAQNTVDVLNELIQFSSFKPSRIILMTGVPNDLNRLEQLGLSDAVAAIYQIASTTSGSVLLRRK
jgi:hypothetical protein